MVAQLKFRVVVDHQPPILALSHNYRIVVLEVLKPLIFELNEFYLFLFFISPNYNELQIFKIVYVIGLAINEKQLVY